MRANPDALTDYGSPITAYLNPMDSTKTASKTLALDLCKVVKVKVSDVLVRQEIKNPQELHDVLKAPDAIKLI